MGQVIEIYKLRLKLHPVTYLCGRHSLAEAVFKGWDAYAERQGFVRFGEKYPSPLFWGGFFFLLCTFVLMLKSVHIWKCNCVMLNNKGFFVESIALYSL
jgi:hypothetical protein